MEKFALANKNKIMQFALANRMVKNGIHNGKGSSRKMGRYTPSRADTLCRGENKGGDKVWQILDDTPWRSSAKLGRRG